MLVKLSTDLSKKEEIRIVLVGKTGVGKSAVGNTILGRQDLGRRAFVSKLASSSVTEKCSKQAGQLKQDGQSGTQSVFVIDTPGLFGKEGMKETLDEIKRCISFSSPGPHVFLVVIQAGRFTPEESNAVNMIQITFGKQAQCYTMVLFTRGDDLEAEGTMIEDIISGTEGLNTFVKQCNGRYHVFNNRDKSPSQVTELLRKISEMVDMNGGSHYTNEMFQEAERAITEEMRKILLENPALSLEEARKRAEKDNSFIRKCAFVVVASAIGGAIGAIKAGPAGAALGVAAGGAAAGSAAATGSVAVGSYTDEYEKAIEGEIRMIRQKEPGLSGEEARKRAERDIWKSGLVVVGGVIGALRGAAGGAAAGPGGAATGAIRGALGGAREAAYVSDQCVSQ